MLAKFHGVAAEAEPLHHQFGRADAALDDTAMLRAAKSLKLKARKIKVTMDQLTDLPLPAIARQVDGRYAIIARVHEGKALIQSPLKQSPEAVSLDVLETMCSGDVLLLTKRSLLPGSLATFDSIPCSQLQASQGTTRWPRLPGAADWVVRSTDRTQSIGIAIGLDGGVGRWR